VAGAAALLRAGERTGRVETARDLHFGELATLWPLAVLMLVMGLAPSLWLPAIETGGEFAAAGSNETAAPLPPSVAADQVASLPDRLRGGQR
jgi:ribose/xylose/arabinose/galactoside ABC-type transport system permease subunit